jgi:hypothetical protein
MWQIQLAPLHFIVYRVFRSSSTLYNTSLLARSIHLISPPTSSAAFNNFQRTDILLSETTENLDDSVYFGSYEQMLRWNLGMAKQRSLIYTSKCSPSSFGWPINMRTRYMNSNQIDALFFFSLLSYHASTCFGRIISPSSGRTMYICGKWYLLHFWIDYQQAS